MRSLIATSIVLVTSISSEACEPGMAWVQSQVKSFDFKQVWSKENTLSVELGPRPYILGILVDPHDCAQVEKVLATLQKFNKEDHSEGGIAFVFSSSFEDYKKQFPSKYILKEYVLDSLNLQKYKTLESEWRDFNKNPKKLLELGGFFKYLDSMKSKANKVLGKDDVLSFKEKLKKVEMNSKDWSLEKLFSFNQKIKDLLTLNQKISDLDLYIKLYDEVRRSLWENAQLTSNEIKSLSPQLKGELSKGKQNLEKTLKVIRQETEELEKNIKKIFEESGSLLENELKVVSP